MDDREPQEQFQHFVVDSKSLWSSAGGMNIVLIICCFGGGGELSLSQTVSPAMEPFIQPLTFTVSPVCSMLTNVLLKAAFSYCCGLRLSPAP